MENPMENTSGWWLSPTHLKNRSSSIGILFPIYGKIKNVPNHKPDMYFLQDRKKLYKTCEECETLILGKMVGTLE